MESIIAHYKFRNNVFDSMRKVSGNLQVHNIYEKGMIGMDAILRSKNEGEGIIFNIGSVLEVNPIPLIGDYSISTWFEIPLPPNSWHYYSLCSGSTDSHVPCIIQKSNFHLGVWNSNIHNSGVFLDSGFDVKTLCEGKHFLVIIADDKHNKTDFYIDNNFVGTAKFKSKTQISHIGNNGTPELGYQQHFGWIYDFRVYNKKLPSIEIEQLYKNGLKDSRIKKQHNKENEIAVKITNVSKTFKIRHETRKTIFEYLTSIGKNKNVQESKILRNISFSVKRGEVFGIVGLNGSGKTTLLKIISGIYEPDEGGVKINGEIIPILELGTGFNVEFTAKDNIILYGLILGFSKKEITSKVDKIIKFAGLENFEDVKLKNFSAGMNARLAFSTAIQINPDIILLDEILSVGDIIFQQKSFDAIMEYKKMRKTIIFVSHSIEQIENICDRAILLHNGKIISEGNPEQIIRNYRLIGK